MRWIPRATQVDRALALGADAHSIRTLVVRPTLVKIALVTTGMGVLTAGAWVSAPFYPVPMTMQTLAVLLVGGLLGPKLGSLSVVSYLVIGFCGAPVFHNGLGGLTILVGPTAGYLLGFVPAAFLMGLASRRGSGPATGRLAVVRQLGRLTAGAVLAELAIYALGLPWLAVSVGLSLEKAVAVGLAPFVLGDVVKMTVAVGTVLAGRRLLGRWRSLPL
jgi:biotin transport system substrate-specific component